MFAQLVDADPGTFETFVLIALILWAFAVVLTVAKKAAAKAAAPIVHLAAGAVFVASFLWLT